MFMATIQGQLLGPTLFPNRAIEKCKNWDFSRSRIWRVKCGRASNCGCRENISSSFLATHQPHHTGHTPATLYWPHTSHTILATHQPHYTPTTPNQPHTHHHQAPADQQWKSVKNIWPLWCSLSGSTKSEQQWRKWDFYQNKNQY